jgi:hypothetical protein
MGESAKDSGGETLRIRGRPGRLIATSTAAFAAALAILGALLALRAVMSPAAAALIAAALAAGLAADLLLWWRRGIREIVMDPRGLTVTRGPDARSLTVSPQDVQRVTLTRRLGRLRVVLRLAPGELRVLGIRLPLPRRLVIREDAFGSREFRVFSDRLSAWEGGGGNI